MLKKPISPKWQVISTAPFDHDLELAVIEHGEPHALVFPCRRMLSGWNSAETKKRRRRKANPIPLLVIRRQHLAGCRVHKVDARAGDAGHRLVDTRVARRGVIGDPTLHVVPCRGASVDQSGQLPSRSPKTRDPSQGIGSLSAAVKRAARLAQFGRYIHFCVHPIS
jgi:hypothetical protein